MDAKRSYDFINKGKFAGDYSRQEKALDGLNAADGLNSLSYTIWTYCPDSLHKWGDGWNVEDLSLWSEDDVPQQLQRTDVADNVYNMRSVFSSKPSLLNQKPAQALISANGVSRASSSTNVNAKEDGNLAEILTEIFIFLVLFARGDFVARSSLARIAKVLASSLPCSGSTSFPR